MLRYCYYAVVGFVLALFCVSISFLYSNFYLTLANSKEVNSLIGKVSVVSLDSKKLQEAIDAVKKKQSIQPESSSSDPFYPSSL